MNRHWNRFDARVDGTGLCHRTDTAGRNPSRVIRSLYLPGGSDSKRYSPVVPVVLERKFEPARSPLPYGSAATATGTRVTSAPESPSDHSVAMTDPSILRVNWGAFWPAAATEPPQSNTPNRPTPTGFTTTSLISGPGGAYS